MYSYWSSLQLQVTNSSVESDFFSSSNAVSFSDGQTTATALLLLQNDDVPEGEETFIVQITGKMHKPFPHKNRVVVRYLFCLQVQGLVLQLVPLTHFR